MTHPLIQKTSGPPKVSFEEEQELIAAVIKGESRPVKRLASLTWNILRKKLGSLNSDDHVYEVFTETYLKLRDQLNAGKYTYRQGKGIVAYFLYLGGFVVKDFLKKHNRNYSVPPFPQKHLPEPFPPAIQEHPFNQIEYRFLRDRLDKAMEEISAKCRRILKKIYYEQYFLKEIAPIVELKQSSMKQTKGRCRKGLLKAYFKIFDIHIMHDFNEVQ